ncbi:MAG: hypothetical protein HYX75_08935 [Acidobacteria bacterium]|nr:hypothetical protein [Acidobacteriota bacterium]
MIGVRQTVKSAIGMALVLAALILPRGAVAQGAFYQEEVRDGRIYVFNNMVSYDNWRKSGEMGVAITRLGAGPAGETIIFDTEEAIHLYNFRHNLQGEVMIKPAEKKPVMVVSWKDGKTKFETDSAGIEISNRIQFRYTYTDPEVGDPLGAFRIRRAKTKFEGWFFNKKLTGELQLNWPDTANPLEDANLNVDFRGNKSIMIKAGQFKVPFGRQELTSSGSQEFVDRSLVSGEFAKGRDIGVQVWGMAMNGKIDWRAGVFNGAGRTVAKNDNNKYQTDVRITFMPNGDPKYSESDFESSSKPLYAVAVQVEQNNLHGATTGVDLKKTTFGFDGVLKYKGLYFFGEYFNRDNEPETGAKYTTSGYGVQIGYFVVPKTFEVAFRYASLDPTDAKSSDDRTETGIAAGYFLNKHALKWQTDYRRLEDDATGRTDNELRSQLQFIF